MPTAVVVYEGEHWDICWRKDHYAIRHKRCMHYFSHYDGFSHCCTKGPEKTWGKDGDREIDKDVIQAYKLLQGKQ